MIIILTRHTNVSYQILRNLNRITWRRIDHQTPCLLQSTRAQPTKKQNTESSRAQAPARAAQSRLVNTESSRAQALKERHRVVSCM